MYNIPKKHYKTVSQTYKFIVITNMKTTILKALVVIWIVIGMAFLADHWWAWEPPPTTTATVQSVDLEVQPQETPIIYCPLYEDIYVGKLPIFSYRDENTGHPLQENVNIRSVIAGINNGKAICRYTSNNGQQMFSIVIPGSFTNCTFENDEYVWFACE